MGSIQCFVTVVRITVGQNYGIALALNSVPCFFRCPHPPFSKQDVIAPQVGQVGAVDPNPATGLPQQRHQLLKSRAVAVAKTTGKAKGEHTRSSQFGTVLRWPGKERLTPIGIHNGSRYAVT